MFCTHLTAVVKDGMKSSGPLRQVIDKAASVVAYARKSTYATDLLENKKRLQYANATRWNSELLMISSILRISKEKLNQSECSKLTTYDCSLLQDLCTILTPLKK